MTQIKKVKLYEEVMLRIEEMIKTDKMQVGDKFQSEKELAVYFGVSRMAIREALSALQAAGLLEVKHGSGIYIGNVNEKLTNPLTFRLLTDKENLLHILELRKGLETEGAFLAAQRADASDIDQLEEDLRLMDEEIKKGGNAANEDFKFHCALIKATHNPAYCNVFDTIANVFYDGLLSSHEYLRINQGPRLVILDEHRVIFEAIKSKQAEQARDNMRKHLKSVEIKMRRIDFI